MKRITLLTVAILLLFPAIAQETKPEIDATPSKEVELLRLANNLAKYGYDRFSAMALVEAASIFSEISTQELTPESYEQEVHSDNPTEAKKIQKVEFSPETLLNDAEKFADGNANLLAIISKEKEALNNVTRGRVGGPARRFTSVDGYSTDTFRISFVEGQYAEVLVSGDGDTDLDLYVYDSNGNLIVYDDDYTDDCYVRWIPAWTGTFVVKILNRGPVYNEYVIITN